MSVHINLTNKKYNRNQMYYSNEINNIIAQFQLVCRFNI